MFFHFSLPTDFPLPMSYRRAPSDFRSTRMVVSGYIPLARTKVKRNQVSKGQRALLANGAEKRSYKAIMAQADGVASLLEDPFLESDEEEELIYTCAYLMEHALEQQGGPELIFIKPIQPSILYRSDPQCLGVRGKVGQKRMVLHTRPYGLSRILPSSTGSRVLFDR